MPYYDYYTVYVYLNFHINSYYYTNAVVKHMYAAKKENVTNIYNVAYICSSPH